MNIITRTSVVPLDALVGGDIEQLLGALFNHDHVGPSEDVESRCRV